MVGARGVVGCAETALAVLDALCVGEGTGRALLCEEAVFATCAGGSGAAAAGCVKRVFHAFPSLFCGAACATTPSGAVVFGCAVSSASRSPRRASCAERVIGGLNVLPSSMDCIVLRFVLSRMFLCGGGRRSESFARCKIRVDAFNRQVDTLLFVNLLNHDTHLLAFRECVTNIRNTERSNLGNMY